MNDRVDFLLLEEARQKVKTWYDLSREHNHHKCIITGRRTSTIHHIIPLTRIVSEVLRELGLENKPAHDYTVNERNDIFDNCLKKHFDYGYGASICAKLHKLYHAEYKAINEETFTEFVNKYKNLIANGEYVVFSGSHYVPAQTERSYNFTITFKTTKSFMQAAKQHAAETGRTLAGLIEWLLRQELKKGEKEMNTWIVLDYKNGNKSIMSKTQYEKEVGSLNDYDEAVAGIVESEKQPTWLDLEYDSETRQYYLK